MRQPNTSDENIKLGGYQEQELKNSGQLGVRKLKTQLCVKTQFLFGGCC